MIAVTEFRCEACLKTQNRRSIEIGASSCCDRLVEHVPSIPTDVEPERVCELGSCDLPATCFLPTPFGSSFRCDEHGEQGASARCPKIRL